MAKMRLLIVPIFLAVLFADCVVPPPPAQPVQTGIVKIQTEWVVSQGQFLRVVDPSATTVLESDLDTGNATLIELAKSRTAGPKLFFVEILSARRPRIFGRLTLFKITKLTEMTNVKLEITDQIFSQVLEGKVSFIYIKDPSAGDELILQLELGNRMPPDMETAYANKRIKK